MFKIAVLTSGGGSNLQSIIDHIENGYLNDVVISFVIASKNNIKAIERAKCHNIPVYVINKELFTNPNDEIIKLCKTNKIDLIVLAGYLSILSGEILKQYKNRIINIHPSLIPKFCGPKMYGHFVHEAVYNAKESKTGCSVHYVTDVIDGGKIILQKEVILQPTDLPEDIAAKVLKLEHIALPQAIKKIKDSYKE